MLSPRAGSPRRSNRRRWSTLACAAILGLIPATGCQVEYAGMTLPSGKYMHDDTQYFPGSPSFAYANTQAATQRARMNAMGIATPPLPGVATPNAPGNALNMPQTPMTPPGGGAGGAPGAPPLNANARPGVPNPTPVPPPPGTTVPPQTAPAPPM
jgi:hypothetical protein